MKLTRAKLKAAVSSVARGLVKGASAYHALSRPETAAARTDRLLSAVPRARVQASFVPLQRASFDPFMSAEANLKAAMPAYMLDVYNQLPPHMQRQMQEAFAKLPPGSPSPFPEPVLGLEADLKAWMSAPLMDVYNQLPPGQQKAWQLQHALIPIALRKPPPPVPPEGLEVHLKSRLSAHEMDIYNQLAPGQQKAWQFQAYLDQQHA